MTGPTRPALRYLGGKWRLAPWIITHFPPHAIYVEGFGGAASVMLQKERAAREIYNDLDDELVNLFAILRHPEARAYLLQLVRLTPYAVTEFERAFSPTADRMESARRLLVRSHMGHGTRGTGFGGSMGFRRDGLKGRTDTAGNWASFDEQLEAIGERFRGVILEKRPAADLIADFDTPDALIFLDPPYLPATRSGKRKRGEGYHTYSHEMTPAEHADMLALAASSRAQIVICGYLSDLYDRALSGWTRKTTAARSHGNAPRTEVMWLNPAATAGLAQADLFNNEARSA